MELKVQIKQAGRRENKIITARLLLKDEPKTVGELVASVAKAVYGDFFRKTQLIEAFEQGTLGQVLIYTDEELERKASEGKIDFGFLKSKTVTSEHQAVENARLAVEDGLAAVFIDGKRYENLLETLNLTGEETLTFVKLTMLSGRMW